MAMDILSRLLVLQESMALTMQPTSLVFARILSISLVSVRVDEWADEQVEWWLGVSVGE